MIEDQGLISDEQSLTSGAKFISRLRKFLGGRATPSGDCVSDPSYDSSRLPMAVVSLTLLLLGVMGWAFGCAAAKETGFILFALVGFGSACAIAVRQGRWPALAFSAPLGLSLVLLMGFVLVETKTWGAGIPVFVVAIVAATYLNVSEVARTVRARGGLRKDPNQRASEMADPSIEVAMDKTMELPVPRAATDETGVREPGKRRRLSVVAVALALVGLVVCVACSLSLQGFVPHGPGALLAALSPAWYFGMACVIAAVVVGLVVAGPIAGIAVAVLQLAVTLTPAIAYSLPRYSWTYKHIGLVEYVLAHGSVNPKIDIYQAWPGLFAGVAWLCHALGMQNPTAIARWWPPVIDLATVLVVQRLAFRVLGSSRRSWLAASIVVVGNMLGQDYFSPQATGFLLAMAIFAAVYRRRDEPRGLSRADWVFVIAMIVAVAVTHQLSPYMVTGATVVLVIFGLCRSRLVPAVAFVAGAGWALLHISIVRHYFNFNQFGDVTTNVLTKGFVSRSVHKSALIHADSYAMAAEVLLIGILAVLVLAQRRTTVHLALALCAASGLGLLLANSYGNEGAFRVVLFALPWLAILCADWNSATAPRLYWSPVASLPLLLGAYLFADYGLDFMNAVRPGDLQAVQTFEQTAPAGSRLFSFGDGYLPVRADYRYNLLEFRYYPYIVSAQHASAGRTGQFNPVISYGDFMAHTVLSSSKLLRLHRTYVIFASQPEAVAEQLQLATESENTALENQFRRSDQWRLVQKTSTAELFELGSLIEEIVPPSIAGIPQDGQRLTVDRGFWQSLNPLRFSYQWEMCDTAGKACTPIVGATHGYFRLSSSDIGHPVTVVVRATDTKGRTRQATAAPTSVVGNPPPPVNISAPTILGAAQDGDVLTLHVGKWRSPEKLTFSYQWQECRSATSGCSAILGATKSRLLLRKSLVGSYIDVVVTATDLEGQQGSSPSAEVGPVQPHR